jgi:hypothetical protein
MDSGKKQEIQCIAFEAFRKSAFSIESPLVFLRSELSPLQGRERRYRLAPLRRAGTEFLALRSGSPPSPQVHTHLPPHLPRAATRGLFSVAKSAFEALYPMRRREPHQLQLPYRNSHRPENGNVSVLRTPGSGTVQPTSTKRFTSIS